MTMSYEGRCKESREEWEVDVGIRSQVTRDKMFLGSRHEKLQRVDSLVCGADSRKVSDVNEGATECLLHRDSVVLDAQSTHIVTLTIDSGFVDRALLRCSLPYVLVELDRRRKLQGRQSLHLREVKAAGCSNEYRRRSL